MNKSACVSVRARVCVGEGEGGGGAVSACVGWWVNISRVELGDKFVGLCMCVT